MNENQGKNKNQISDSYTLVGIALLGIIVILFGTLIYEVFSDDIKKVKIEQHG